MQDSQNSPTVEATMQNIIPEFITYNRYKELEKREMQKLKLERQIKEEEWEKELATAMGEEFSLEEKIEDSSATTVTQRTQDGCDILEARENCSFSKSHSEDGQSCAKDCNHTYCNKANNKPCENNTVRRVKKLSDSECETKKENVESTSFSTPSKNDKTKYGSESDFLSIKKKHCKISFDMSLFNSKHKSQSNRNFSRASSLKVNSVKDAIPENRDNTPSEVLNKVPDFSDNVKNRIAHSPKLKNSKMSQDNQKASTFMVDANYQKTKNEVIKSYQASLCSLKNDDSKS